MHRIEGKVEEERRGRIMPLDELHSLVAEQRCGISLLLNDFVVAEPVHLAIDLVGEVVDLADQRTVCVTKSALPWPEFLVRMAEMPFADNGSLITSVLECLWQQPLVSRKAIGVALGNNCRL